MNPKESEPRNSKKGEQAQELPRSVESIGERIKILEDGRWVVDWKISGSERWSSHVLKDFDTVMAQNSIVIDGYTGRDIILPEGVELEPLSIGPSIPELNQNLENLIEKVTPDDVSDHPTQPILIRGELQKISKLADSIQRVLPRLASGNIPADEAQRILSDIESKIGRVRNPHKIEARNRLKTAQENDKSSRRIDDPLQAYMSLLKRLEESSSITNSLYDRGSELLKWVKGPHIKAQNWQTYIGKALRDIEGGITTPEKRTEWATFLCSESGMSASLSELNGSPFSDLRDQEDIKKLIRSEDIILGGDAETLIDLLGKAYLPLQRIEIQRMLAIRDGRYDKYKTRSQIRDDRESLEYYRKRNPTIDI